MSVLAASSALAIVPPRRAYSPEPECRIALTALELALRFRAPASRREEDLLARLRRVQATVRRDRVADEYACFHALAALTRFYVSHAGASAAFAFTDAQTAAIWDAVAFIDTMGERAVHPSVSPTNTTTKEGVSHA